jgi:NADH dehydrogenase FAD-containing subunit
MKAYRARIKAAKNIVVVGGGAVGIEIAGEIAATYPKSDGKKITLIHKGKSLMNDTYNSKFRKGLQTQLLDLGVNLHLGDALQGDYNFEETNGQTLTTIGGAKLEHVDLVIQATGGKVNTDLLKGLVPSLLSSNGVKVKPTFQLEGHDNIFAVGDVADLPEQKQAAKVHLRRSHCGR